VNDLLGLDGLTNDDRYNLACALALSVGPAGRDQRLGPLVAAAAAESLASGSMRLLRRLVGSEYFRPPNQAKLLSEDPDLNSLRNRPDFQQLLADVANGPKPR
jgi:hypothetical protein